MYKKTIKSNLRLKGQLLKILCGKRRREVISLNHFAAVILEEFKLILALNTLCHNHELKALGYVKNQLNKTDVLFILIFLLADVVDKALIKL